MSGCGNRRFLTDRRTFLRGAGITMALPMLEAFGPRSMAGAVGAGAQDADGPRRMVMINTSLGLHTPLLFPEQTGADYEMTPYLKQIEGFRDQFTVLSGLSHPEVDGGHNAEKSYLTAAPHPGRSSFTNSVSVDQVAAEQIGHRTRFGYLALSTEGSSRSLSWTRGGVQIPADDRPSRVFARLFLEGSEAEKQRQMRRLRDGQSIMDVVNGQARRMEKRLGAKDRETLDQYFTSVRELEGRLVKGEEWARTPKPELDVERPEDVQDRTDFVGRTELMYELIHLALQTDSTRLITLQIQGFNAVPKLQGVDSDWHNLSHHGKDPEKIEQLQLIELEEMRLLNDLLTRLHGTKERGGSLLDKTMLMFGSNLGNASSHDNRDMPMILAGGGFKHGQHLRWDPDDHPPLCNLYVSMLQQMGLEIGEFASGRSTLTRLEPTV